MPALLEGGYSKIGNLGSDAFQSPPSVVMQSNEAHNALKRFLRDGYRFSSTSDVYAFLAPLESASGWSGEDSQLLLTTLSDGNGLSRITDVLLWSDVEFNAGTDRTTLSFQRGYFPVIRFLASGFIVKSTMTKCANTLYQTFLDNFDFIKLHLEAAIDDMVNSCSFKDPNAEQERALSGAELFSCLATVLFECMSRFKTAIIDCRVLVEIIDKLRLWSSDWIQGMTSVPPVFQDILCDNPDAKRVVVSHIEKQINRLLAIAEREMAKVDRVHEKHVPSALLGSGANDESIKSLIKAASEGPGELRKDRATITTSRTLMISASLRHMRNWLARYHRTFLSMYTTRHITILKRVWSVFRTHNSVCFAKN
ncbi:hypothetical protein CC2G_009023 [Coprinopsis cinerea AmutBmut pab1-1]|nr:hypothetical protein CC2G_009023 [Coprinopsis cinerea AmutBmut pab1-1]